MDPDGVVDHELEASQTDAIIGQLPECEGGLRVAHVHHDLHAHLRDFAQVLLRALELEQALIDVPRVALGARHRDFLAHSKLVRRIAAANDCRNAQLASDDRGVASAATAVSDNGSSLLHDWLPIRIRHVCHQHLPLLEVAHLIDALQDVHLAGADALANCASARQDTRALLQHLVVLNDTDLLLRGHGLWTGLHNVQLSIVAIAGPLDVHGTAVMLLDLHSHDCQVLDLFVRGRPGLLLLPRGVHSLRAAASLVHHLDQFRTHGSRDDGVLAFRQSRFEHVPLVGVNCAADNRLPKTVGAGHENDIAEATLRVQRKHHAGGPRLAAHHLLASGAELDLGVLEAAVVPVGDGSVREQGCKDKMHLLLQVLVTHDVQVGLLLARKGGVRKVLCSRRRADCKGEGVAAAAYALPLCLQFRLEVGLERCIHDLVADGLPDLHELVDVRIDGFVRQLLVDEVVDAALVKELLVGVGRGAEATGNRDADL
mmetsp:Transcript_119800/g.301182  ORF Transcript_119800/g.301182 Transcript_119800/m.301182 type:complete len:485 (+) Transcript_119800:1214-2668(+)